MSSNPKRPRGAPKGNQNALVHGFYSRILRPRPDGLRPNDILPPPASGADLSPREEIEAMRRLIQSYSQAALRSQTYGETLELARSLSRTLARLASLQRHYHP